MIIISHEIILDTLYKDLNLNGFLSKISQKNPLDMQVAGFAFCLLWRFSLGWLLLSEKEL